MIKNHINTIQTKKWTLDEAYAFCADVTQKHYENFPVASLFLPSEKRPFVQSIYAFARIADDFADEDNVDPQTRLQHLSGWENSLKLCYEGKAEHPIFIALADTVSKLSIPIEPLTDLLKAFRMDVTKNSYDNFDEVLQYCKYSANPVGRLVLLIFGYHDEEYFKFSDYICTALQLTNFYQDVAIDLQKNRIYIPKDELIEYDYNEAELKKKVYNKQFENLMKLQVERTRKLFYEGAPLPLMVDKDLQLELKLVWFGGMAVLRKLEFRKYNVFKKQFKLNPINKIMIFLRALFYTDISKFKKRSLWDLT
jgi:hydroxysqualene synthase